jgi:predicted small lipoprotein YifL
MSHSIRSVALCIALLALGSAGGCGQKGALYLPEDAKSTVPASGTGSTAAPASAPAPTNEDPERPADKRAR